MSFNSVDPLKSTGALLDLIAQKQKVIGDNLANMDTPGYARKDLNFAKCLGNLDGSLETRLSAKFGSANGPGTVEEDDVSVPINPADELMELQKNSLLYSMAARRMSNVITEMKTVINVGK